MKRLLRLLKISLLLEFRLKETPALAICLSLMLAITVSLGMGSAVMDASGRVRLFPAILWIIFLISSTVSTARSFEYEIENRAIDGIFLTGTPPWLLYLAKTASNTVLLFTAQLTTLAALSVFLDIDITGFSGEVLLVSVCAIIACSALATILSGMTVASHMRQILLPLLMLPLIFPILFAATELTAQSMSPAGLEYGSPWFSLLIGLDVLYLAVGINLFEFVIRE